MLMPSHNNNNSNNKSSSSINTTSIFNPNPPSFQSYPHSKFNKLHLFLLFLFSMATSFILLLYSLLFLSISPSPSSARHPHLVARPTHPSASAVVQQACGATRFPDACGAMMSSAAAAENASTSTALDIIQAAFTVSAQNLNAGQGMVKDILAASAHDQNRSRAAQTCLELLNMADSRAKASADALSKDNGNLKDARAWSSAALAYQYDCWSALKYVNNSAAVNSTMSFFDTTLIVSTSNALSMLRALDVLGKDPASWGPPKTERDGFWEPVLGDGDTAPGINFAGLSWDATVCKDGANGSYKSVQAAVDAAPENLQGAKRFVIKIKEGVYQETVRVPFSKTNVVFLGDGMGKTVITASLNTGIMGITTYHTATVGILGDGFMASGVTFENTAGPNAHQAVAFRSDSDFSYIENCEFLGNQDTVYVHTLRQLYKSCRIVGNVDFIFGNAAAVFQDCSILVRPRQLHPEKGGTNAIAAHGRTDPAQTSGFVFLGCLINGTEEYMNFYRANPRNHKDYLGRPWKAYSRTVYVNCIMESIIVPEGWLPWDGDFALSTLYYGEFGNSGPGANVSKRVPWSVQIPKERVSTYYVQNFLRGSGWTTTTSTS